MIASSTDDQDAAILGVPRGDSGITSCPSLGLTSMDDLGRRGGSERFVAQRACVDA